jgi:hypothetical protein
MPPKQTHGDAPVHRTGSTQSVASDLLQTHLKRCESETLRARLKYMEAEAFRKYLAPLQGVPIVHPEVLPTQASLRWSTRNPPVVNFPDAQKAKLYGLPDIRSVFVPHLGWWWASWDWDAVEAKLAAAYAQEPDDLRAFELGWDVHTLTACAMFPKQLGVCPTPEDPHGHPAAAEWRATVGWGGKGDRRRHLAKTARYAMTYGEDEYAVLSAKGVEQLGLTRAELLYAGRAYLTAKPKYHEWKRRVWDECRWTRESRTFLGHRRRLFGDPQVMARQGLNHKIQGAVAGIMNTTLIALVHPERGAIPEGIVGWNAHDGATLTFPVARDVEATMAVLRPIVERVWDVEGSRITLTASWSVTRPSVTRP